MKNIKLNFVFDEKGKKIGVALSASDFERCVDILEDYQDYMLIKERSTKKEKLIPIEEVMKNTLKRTK